MNTEPEPSSDKREISEQERKEILERINFPREQWVEAFKEILKNENKEITPEDINSKTEAQFKKMEDILIEQRLKYEADKKTKCWLNYVSVMTDSDIPLEVKLIMLEWEHPYLMGELELYKFGIKYCSDRKMEFYLKLRQKCHCEKRSKGFMPTEKVAEKAEKVVI